MGLVQTTMNLNSYRNKLERTEVYWRTTSCTNENRCCGTRIPTATFPTVTKLQFPSATTTVIFYGTKTPVARPDSGHNSSDPGHNSSDAPRFRSSLLLSVLYCLTDCIRTYPFLLRGSRHDPSKYLMDAPARPLSKLPLRHNHKGHHYGEA